MANNIRKPQSAVDEPATARANTSTLLRIGWMLGGNAVLVILALTIFMERSWTITVKDGLFWLVVAAVVAMRYLDITRFGGQTADGEPATRVHLVRFAVVMPALCSLVWTIAQSVQIVGSPNP